MMTTLIEPVTSEQMFRMVPNRKIDRWLWHGELKEAKTTKRNPSHAKTTISVGFNLKRWLMTRPMPRGSVYGGEAYFRIRKDPDTNVGVDVALSTPEQEPSGPTSFIEGPPAVAVKVLSPYDKKIHIDEMIEEYLDCGTPMVWIVDPRQKTLTIYRNEHEPVMYSGTQVMKDLPGLPGFECPVNEMFE